jgi:RNA polymerase sigma factor FliA
MNAAPSASSPATSPDRELIAENLHLVDAAVARLKRRVPAHIDAQDLRSVGLLGLVNAARRFVPAPGRTFPAFATVRIQGAMLDELRRLDPCSRQARARAKLLRDTGASLAQQLGRDARPEEVRAALRLSPAEFRKWNHEATPPRHLAIDRPLDDSDDTGASLHDLLADDSQSDCAAHTERRDMVEMLAKLVAELPPSRQRLLTMHYQQGMTIGEIAAELGVSSSRISQLHSRVVERLRIAFRQSLAV